MDKVLGIIPWYHRLYIEEFMVSSIHNFSLGMLFSLFSPVSDCFVSSGLAGLEAVSAEVSSVVVFAAAAAADDDDDDDAVAATFALAASILSCSLFTSSCNSSYSKQQVYFKLRQILYFDFLLHCNKVFDFIMF